MVSKIVITTAKYLSAANISLTEEQYLAVTDVMETYAKKVHEKTLKSVSGQYETAFDDLVDTSQMNHNDRDTWSSICLLSAINHSFDKINEIVEKEFDEV